MQKLPLPNEIINMIDLYAFDQKDIYKKHCEKIKNMSEEIIRNELKPRFRKFLIMAYNRINVPKFHNILEKCISLSSEYVSEFTRYKNINFSIDPNESKESIWTKKCSKAITFNNCISAILSILKDLNYSLYYPNENDEMREIQKQVESCRTDIEFIHTYECLHNILKIIRPIGVVSEDIQKFEIFFDKHLHYHFRNEIVRYI